ncbi:hypothetical protein [Streptomyces jeddahensis]|uniref:Uncharacterized protein n=1 Tax=Streptomyces jeddahensis TaxID=1716141 RepID=A0A177HRD3_9ACTN|nr:hypothetical protein [Streptomyces jeddahensis]OAH13200.1 hypothetical protein STSP_35250 [Streptomyces jeddahensis]
MSIDDAEVALRHIEGFRTPGNSEVPTRGVAHYTSRLSVQAYTGTGGIVNAIEVFRPDSSVSVQYEGIDLFSLPASEVIALLRSRTAIEVEERGSSVTAPDLLLALWRPFAADSVSDAQGYYFQSALIAEPGYYD